MSEQKIYLSLTCEPREAPIAAKNFFRMMNEQEPVKVPTQLMGVAQGASGVVLIFEVVIPERRAHAGYAFGALENIKRVVTLMSNYFPAFHAPPIPSEAQTAEAFMSAMNISNVDAAIHPNYSPKISIQSQFNLQEDINSTVGASK